MKTSATSRLRIGLALAGGWALLTFNGMAQTSQQRQGSEHRGTTAQPAAAQGYDAFRMLQTRNIFDPDRRPILTQATTLPQTPPASRADYVALTGIMLTQDKALAFFSGSRADYNKVLAVNGDIAGAKLTKITTSAIEVERDGKRISIAVGQTVPLDASAPAAAPQNLPPPTNNTAAPSANTPPADASEVLRRMMERRQQQLK